MFSPGAGFYFSDAVRRVRAPLRELWPVLHAVPRARLPVRRR
ncbi:MAG: hypothetical protein JWN48_2932, partial [Myxococcaceae bacterium]|nr:hypothetical protein [Myxococcaceae bacterium]